MENTSYIALSRQTTLWRRLDMVANNLANMNTTGYRGQDVLFTDYLARVPNDDSVFRDQVRFVTDFGTVTDTREGPLQETGNPMDLAMEQPDTFFVIDTPAGEKFSRAGKFQLTNEGQLVTQDGHAVLTDAGTPVFIAPTETRFEVSADGTVRTENGPVGKLRVVSFEEPQRLRRYGNGLWETAPGQESRPAENPKVIQGALEGSNVNGVVEMTKMISVQRTYQQIQELINQEDQRVRDTINAWGRTNT